MTFYCVLSIIWYSNNSHVKSQYTCWNGGNTLIRIKIIIIMSIVVKIEEKENRKHKYGAYEYKNRLKV